MASEYKHYVLTEFDGALLVVPNGTYDTDAAVALFRYPVSDVKEAVRVLRAVNMAYNAGHAEGMEAAEI